MPAPCQIVIEGLQADPPYVFGDQPTQATVVARSSDHCTRLRVTVRAAGSSSPAITDQEIDVDFSNAVTGTGTTLGLVTTTFLVPPVDLQCGDQLWVEATCVQDASCTASGWFRIVCKPDPGGGGTPAGGPPGGGDDGGGGRWWPPTRCIFTAAGSAMGLLAALALIAVGIGTRNVALLTAAAALIAVVGISWALWAYWCAPSTCVRLAVLCWVFKRGFIAALPVLAFSTNMVIVLVIVAYGAIAGILVDKLRAQGCAVPSARLPLTQIPT